MTALFLGILGCGTVAAAETSLFAKWGIAPSYRTEFKAGEADREWRQTFNLNRGSRYVDFESRFASQRRENERRNNFERGDDKLFFSLGRPVGFGTLNLETAFQRLSDKTDRSKTTSTDDAVDLAGKFALHKREGSSVNLNVATGFLNEVNVQERYGARSTVDSTTASGWTGGAQVDAQWSPASTVSLASSASFDGVVQNSQTIRYEFEGDEVAVTEQGHTDRSHNQTMRGSLEWTRHAMLSMSIQTLYSDAVSQYYQATEQAQETKSIYQGSTTIRLFGEKAKKFGYILEYYSNENKTEYDLATNARQNTNDDIMLDAFYTMGRIPLLGAIPLVAGSELKARFITSEGRVATQGTASYDTKRLDFSSELRRSLGRRFELVAKYKESLTQDLYDNRQIDKDRLRTEVTTTVKYLPSATFNANLTYTAKNEETIEVPDASAAQTQRQEDYNVQGKYTVLLPHDVSVTQTLQLGATYTFYIFNEEQNSLTRNNRVVSELLVPVYDNTEIRLQHSFRRNDSGSYLYSENLGGRTYSKTRERVTQNLKVSMRYDIVKGLYVTAQEVIDWSYNTTVATASTRVTEKYEFTAEAGITHDFSNGIRLRASAQRINSSVKDDFYRVNASMEKRFK